jgi:hypothetical protein
MHDISRYEYNKAVYIIKDQEKILSDFKSAWLDKDK